MISIYDKFYLFFSIVLESFPISSSGHSRLLQSIFEKFGILYWVSENFDLFLHGPIALVVALFFFNDWFFIVHGLPRTVPFIKKIFLRGFITDGITVMAYFLFFKNLGCLPLWIGFVLTSALLFSLQLYKASPRFSVWNYRNAVVLGLVQSVALIPGISRLGSTFVCARWMGLSIRKSLQLSFLIEWPISCAAFLKGLIGLSQENKIVELLQLKVILVMIVAMVCGFFCLKLLQQILNAHCEWVFSVYLLVVAMGSFLLV